MRAILLVMALLLTACGEQVADNSIRFAVASAPISLDPRMATDATSERINHLLYASLVDFDASFRPVPGIADWQQLGPRRYRFTLRADRAAFHDGSRLTSKDVVDCYRFILDADNASPHRGNLANIAAVKEVDDETVEFTLHKPDALFPGRLVIGIPASHAGGAVVGSGPFRLVDAADLSRLELERVDDGQRFAFVHVADATVRVLKLVRGEIDILQNDLPAELVNYLAGQQGITLREHNGTTFSYIGFNMDDPAVGEPRLRLAIAHAIDRHALVDHLLGNRAELSQSLLSPAHWASLSALEPIRYNPQRARELLAELGYDAARRPRLVYKTTTDALRLRLATVIQQQLAAVGIDMAIQSYDWGTFYADIKAGNFQLYSLSWVGVRSPDIYEYVFHSKSRPPAGANRGRYSNPQVDAMIEAMITAPDVSQIPVSLQAVRETLLDELPYLPLWFEHHVAATGQRVSSYRLSLDGNYDALAEVELRMPGDMKVSAR